MARRTHAPFDTRPRTGRLADPGVELLRDQYLQPPVSKNDTIKWTCASGNFAVQFCGMSPSKNRTMS